MSDVLSRFMNIWEVESHFKCPVIGAMLSVEKHRSILVKCGYDVKKLKPYEYHQVIMSKLTDENNVSVKVNNFIRSQAQAQMLRIADLTDDQVRVLWKQELEAGNVGPMMYAVVSREDTGVGLLCDIHGEVHMLAHANMTGIFDIRKKLLAVEDSLGGLKKKLALKIKTRLMAHYEKRIKNALLKSGLAHNELTRIRDIIANAEPYISPKLAGEAVLTVGSSLTEVADKACGVIAIGPFGCMPNRMSEAILAEAMNRENRLAIEPKNQKLRRILDNMDELPFLAIESDGSPIPQLIHAKLETFLLRAERMHQRMMGD